jgi:hypothetical protein
MKLTWRQQADGSWLARHYPKAQGSLPVPYTLRVTEHDTDSDLPWHWVVKRGEVLAVGDASDLEAARFSAFHEMLQRSRK